MTPLFLACAFEHWALAALLVEQGADPNIAATLTDGGNTFQRSPLYLAAELGNLQTVVTLVKAGASNSLGESPLEATSDAEIRNILLNMR